MSLKGRACFLQARAYTKVLSFLLFVLMSRLSAPVSVMAKSSLFLSRRDGDQKLKYIFYLTPLSFSAGQESSALRAGRNIQPTQRNVKKMGLT